MKVLLTILLVFMIACRERVSDSSFNMPAEKREVAGSIQGLETLSQKLNVPLKKIEGQGIQKIYSDYDLSFILNSWFSESFLLVREEGKYLAKNQSYDSNGFPEVLNFVLYFGDITDIEGDELIKKYKNAGFLQIAEAGNGDPFVLDLNSQDLKVGYLDHEYIWKKEIKDVRAYFKELTSFDKFIELLNNDHEFDYR